MGKLIEVGKLIKAPVPLEVAHEVIQSLNLIGTLVIAGGAARDTILGRVPKDFDLVVIQGSAECERVEELLEHAVNVIRRKLPEATDIEQYPTYRDIQGHIAYVVKFSYKGFDFDVIEYMEYMESPEEQCEYFDTTLNMAYFTYETSESDRLVPVAHPRFIQTLRTGKVEVLDSIDNDVDKRLKYLQSKYPEFEYPFINLELPLV